MPRWNQASCSAFSLFFTSQALREFFSFDDDTSIRRKVEIICTAPAWRSRTRCVAIRYVQIVKDYCFVFHLQVYCGRVSHKGDVIVPLTNLSGVVLSNDVQVLIDMIQSLMTFPAIKQRCRHVWSAP